MITAFRWIGLLEGLSYLILLGVGVPMKYLAHNPHIVKAVGMPHGILFITYIALAFGLSTDLDWPRKRLGQAFLASVLPFGTFVFDRIYLSHKSDTNRDAQL